MPFKKTIVDISPNEAEQMLLRNRNSRLLDKEKVAKYARIMNDGKWEVNTTFPIELDKNDNSGLETINAVSIFPFSFIFAEIEASSNS